MPVFDSFKLAAFLLQQGATVTQFNQGDERVLTVANDNNLVRFRFRLDSGRFFTAEHNPLDAPDIVTVHRSLKGGVEALGLTALERKDAA